MKNHQSIQHSTITRTLLVIGIIIVAFNLRPAITAVGPLVGFIKLDLQISNSLAGFLTTLPLLSFALFSSIAPKLGNRFGSEAMVFIGLLLLISGILIRSTSVLTTLFIGTALVGIGIALLNVLLPSIVKTTFPTKVGIMTSAYSTSMSVFAALGSGLSIPLATGIGLGWEKALLSWLLLA
ncbi:MAG TPA: MFS transporter, partial [Bacilli bacterium]|nr:MFS transporter [Bacilli bacterium]